MVMDLAQGDLDHAGAAPEQLARLVACPEFEAIMVPSDRFLDTLDEMQVLALSQGSAKLEPALWSWVIALPLTLDAWARIAIHPRIGHCF